MCAHKNGHDVPHGTIAQPKLALQIFGHLAGWATMYALAIALILSEFLEKPITPPALIYVTLCANSGYLFDRIKLRNADLDPADLLADPHRHNFLRRHSRHLRFLMAAQWIAAIAIGINISPILGALVPAGILAGFLYSGWRPAKIGTPPRLKDLPALKAILVSCAVVGLASAAVYGQTLPTNRHTVEDFIRIIPWLTIAGMLLIVTGDAVICDLDDRQTDGQFSTRSLPVILGMRRAATVATGLLILGGAMILWDAADDLRIRMLFAGLATISGIRIIRQSSRRDWIDGRMLVVVVCAVLIG